MNTQQYTTVPYISLKSPLDPAQSRPLALPYITLDPATFA